MELMQASRQWATRPDDERFVSLTEMRDASRLEREQSKGVYLPNRSVRAVPVDDGSHKGLAIETPDGVHLPTNWAFGQLAGRASAPGGYLKTLPSEIAADCLNYGIRSRDVEDLGLLVRDDLGDGQADTLAAATGPGYGRIWNDTIIEALIERFGDGVSGDFKVPGEFGRPVPITKSNTTLYKGDRDMFVFLADERHAFQIANRRHGQGGNASRGFFLWNSEVGSKTFGISTFIFDYACCNRIVWGARDVKEFKIRHTSGAPERWIEEIAPALVAYSESSTQNITDAIAQAQAQRIDDIDEFLLKRFTAGQSKGIKLAFDADEDRPIETTWDVVTGVTAYARGIGHQDSRVDIERKGGLILKGLA